MKRFISLLLCVLMIIPQAAIGSLATESVTLESMEVVETVPLIAGSDGYWSTTTDNGESFTWFDYDVLRAVSKVRLNYSDGTYEEISAQDVSSFGYSSNQSYKNQWTADNTYTATLYYENVWCKFDLYISPSDVVSISVAELNTVTEALSGGYTYHSVDSDWDGVPEESGYYYNYYSSQFVKYVEVTYTDGSSYMMPYDEIMSDSHISTNQSFHNQWQAGNTYNATLYYAGVSCDFEVYVTPNNIDRVELVGIVPLMEGVDSYEKSEYVDGEWKYYDYYYPYHAIENEELCVYYDDGTSEIVKLYHYSEEQFIFIDHQSYQDPWMPGNSYNVTMKFMGVDIPFTVSVVADPVESIEVYEVGTLYEGETGYYTTSFSDITKDYDKFFYYPHWALINTVKFNYTDGTYEIVSIDELSSYHIQNNQNCDNYWVGGNTYPATLVYGDHTCEFEVYITPNNIERIEAYEVRPLVEGADNHESEDYVDGEWVCFQEYDVNNAIEKIRVFYNDGTHEIFEANQINFAADGHQTGKDFWEVGNTYPAVLIYKGKRCDFEVSVISDPVESYEVYEYSEVVEGISGGYTTQWEESLNMFRTYYYYDPMSYLETIKVNYTDGTSEIIDAGSVEFDFIGYDQSYENQWRGGNTYSIELKIGDHSFTYDMYITPSDIESIEIAESRPLEELRNGWFDDNVEGKYFKYNACDAVVSIRINYSDGSSEVKPVNELEEYYVGDSNQSIHNQWTAGNSYVVPFMYRGFTCDLEVVIEADPLESIEVYEMRPLMENIDSHEIDDWVSGIGRVFYDFYEVGDAIISLKLNYNDGTSEIVSYYDLENIDVSFDQGYYNQWSVGKYPVTFTRGNISTTVEVEIIPSNVEKIEITEVRNFTEYLDAFWFGESVDGEYVNYYGYDPAFAVNGINVTYTDGTSEYLELYELNYKFDYVQDYYNQWTGGNSYEVTLEYGGKSVIFEIYIEEYPIESIEVIEVVPLVENKDGWINEEYIDGELVEYFYYSPWIALKTIKVNYKDGTSEILDANSSNDIGITCDQGPWGEIWTAGNSYRCVVSYGVCEAEFYVEIVEDPIAKIEVYETKPLQEYYDGYTMTTTVHDTGEVIEWFMYSTSEAILSIKISYKDGTSEIIARENFEDWGTSSNQYYANQWTVGNTYPAFLDYNGYRIEYPVTIVERQKYEYIVQDGAAIITGWSDYDYAREQVDLVIPDEILGYPVIGIESIECDSENTKTITFPESIKFISDYALWGYYNVEKVFVNGSETILDWYTFSGMDSLKEIVISDDHQEYTAIDGIAFDKNVTTIIAYPVGRGDEYVLPETVSDLSFMNAYPNVNFIINENSDAFVVENGITYNKDKTAIYSCDKTVSGDYVMPDTVESIPMMLFQGCENLTSVKLSSKVTEIAYATFDNCPNLKSIELPENLEFIGEYAFSDCPSLEGIVFPESVVAIETKAFINTGLKAISVPDNVEYLGESCFENTNAETVFVGSGIEYIENSVFADNAELTTVTLSEGLAFIGNYVFNNCKSLVTINIPDSVTEVGASVFYNCDSLTYLPMGKGMRYINITMFSHCDGLVDIVIPEGIEYIGSSAFSDCKNLKNVVIPDSALDFGGWIFENCTSLEYLPLGENQTYIAIGEFSGCTGLVDVTIPAYVSIIDNYAFGGCEKLKNVDILGELEYLGRGAFMGCSSLNDFATGDTLTEISMFTFAYSGLENIDIGSNVQHIGHEAFAGSALTSVEIPSNVVNIAYFAFYNCKDLGSITMPDTLVTLGGHTFENTKWYKDQPTGPVYLGTAFYNYKGDIPEGSDREIYIKEGTLSIAGHAFENYCGYCERYENTYKVYDMSGLTSVHVPEGLIEIGECAFYDCYGLSEVYLPASLERIFGGAFEGCNNLQTIYYGGSEEQWNAIFGVAGNYVLENCDIVYNYVDEAPTEVTVIVDGEESKLEVGEEITLETKKLTFDAATGKAYVFLEWIVNGADIVEESDGTIKVSVGSADASISKNTFVHGNVDGDESGTVNGFDVITANLNVKDDAYTVYADMDFDGKLTAMDIIDLNRVIKGSYEYEE